ncbi:TIGR03620 family F420-dependent LLM class oxidoreductase [Nocardioides immobilis]|nr:TIGR03620 family F420-dependent LLM class oxidoreductase [Nocardioides immobilis]
MEMDLGRIGIWTNQLNGLKAAELRDTLQEIEGLGYGALWQGESATGREALTNAALTLSWTDRIVAATGVASIWARDAAGLASAQRMLCESFPYRFLLGLGVSHEGQITARGHDFDTKPLTAMGHYLRSMDIQPAGVLPHPPAPPPRVLAALGPAMLDLARDHAQGAHPFLVTPEQTKAARDVLGPGRILAPELGVLLETDAEAARTVLRGEIKSRLGYPNYRRSLLNQGFTEADLADGGSDALIDRLFAWGSISDVAQRVEEHIASGADHVALYALRPRSGQVPLEEWRELATII